MPPLPPPQEDKAKNSHITDHLANERTFLAWIRTSIGIMAFGFVVQKFALFMRQVSLFFLSPEMINQTETKNNGTPLQTFSDALSPVSPQSIISSSLNLFWESFLSDSAHLFVFLHF